MHVQELVISQRSEKGIGNNEYDDDDDDCPTFSSLQFGFYFVALVESVRYCRSCPATR